MISVTCIGYGYIQRREWRGHLLIRHRFKFEWLGSFRLEYDNKESLTERRNVARVGNKNKSRGFHVVASIQSRRASRVDNARQYQ